MRKFFFLSALIACSAHAANSYTYGVRPQYLVNNMSDGKLKTELKACLNQTPKRSRFSIAHRGAPLQFPEHTREAYLAGLQMGAGMMECDVALTKDLELVCRHSHSDLATTTNILETPLAKKCSVPFVPAVFDDKGELISEAKAVCRTTDITLAEFKSLRGKMDAGNPRAKTVEEFMNATPHFRTDLYSTTGTLMSHKESIALFKEHGVKMIPELKTPEVEMPFNGFTQEDFAQKLLDEYKAAGVEGKDIYPQSFLPQDVEYWLKQSNGKQAVFLDEDMKPEEVAANIEKMKDWKAKGLKYLAPATSMLVKSENGKLVKTDYAKAAKKHGFKIIAWTFERSGLITKSDGGFYFHPVKDVLKKEGDIYYVLDFLAQEVGIVGMFSDWAATMTYYANCKKI